MTTFVCQKCKIEKDEIEFHKRKDRPKGRSSYCKECSNKRWQKYKKENPEKIFENFQNWKSIPKNKSRLKKLWKRRDSKRRKELRSFLEVYKVSKPCMDCEIYYPYYVMDFDHRPNEIKLFNVGNIERANTMKKLLQEIEKCDLVCSNCHRKRTHKRGYKKTIKSNFEVR